MGTHVKAFATIVLKIDRIVLETHIQVCPKKSFIFHFGFFRRTPRDCGQERYKILDA